MKINKQINQINQINKINNSHNKVNYIYVDLMANDISKFHPSDDHDYSLFLKEYKI